MQNRRESDRRLLPKEHSREKLYSRDDKLLVARFFLLGASKNPVPAAPAGTRVSPLVRPQCFNSGSARGKNWMMSSFGPIAATLG
jgi:hypothetical protein